MKIIDDNKIMVFRHDNEYGASYSIGMSKKLQDGSYEKGYFPAKFKKDVFVHNKTKIKLKDAWLGFNTKDKKTYPFIFINDFEIVEEQPTNNTQVAPENPTVPSTIQPQPTTPTKDAYTEFGEEHKEEDFSIELTEDDLPW